MNKRKIIRTAQKKWSFPVSISSVNEKLHFLWSEGTLWGPWKN